jgi:hypothetical protein
MVGVAGGLFEAVDATFQVASAPPVDRLAGDAVAERDLANRGAVEDLEDGAVALFGQPGRVPIHSPPHPSRDSGTKTNKSVNNDVGRPSG